MILLKKIKYFFKRYLLDKGLRNKVNFIPELALVIFGLCTSNYSIIFYGCLALVGLNLILNLIAKRVAIKEIQNKLNSVSTQNSENSDNGIIL